MGDAKRRKDRFEGPIHSVLPYREARSVLAFEINGDGPMPPLAIIHELALVRAFPDLKSGAQAGPAFDHDDVRVTAAEPFEDRLGDWAVVDPITREITEILTAYEFDLRYAEHPDMEGWFSAADGNETLIGIRSASFVRDGGEVITDPVSFMRGRIRTGGQFSFRADESIALQTVRLTPALGVPGGRDHAEHIAILANAIIASNETDPTLLSDAIFFQRCMRDPRAMLGDPTQSEAMHLSAHAALSKIAAELPTSVGMKAFCAALGAPLAIWAARSNDDSLAWMRFGEAFAALGRAGHPIPERAPMWRAYARTDNVEGQTLLKASEAFLETGEQLAGGFLSSGTMRLVKVQDTTFLAFTDTNAFHEVVAWN